jgi:hypothetical protein
MPADSYVWMMESSAPKRGARARLAVLLAVIILLLVNREGILTIYTWMLTIFHRPLQLVVLLPSSDTTGLAIDTSRWDLSSVTDRLPHPFKAACQDAYAMPGCKSCSRDKM